MGKSLKDLKGLNKKAAYDLGRKAIYFTVALIVIALIFVYVSNSMQNYQFKSLNYLSKVSQLVQVKGLEKCISQKDNNRIYLGELSTKLDIDSIKKCLEENGLSKDRGFRITVEGKQPIKTTDEPIEYESYERYFLFQYQPERYSLQYELKKVVIEVEKIEIPYAE